jgi:hypothetical protein
MKNLVFEMYYHMGPLQSVSDRKVIEYKVELYQESLSAQIQLQDLLRVRLHYGKWIYEANRPFDHNKPKAHIKLHACRSVHHIIYTYHSTVHRMAYINVIGSIALITWPHSSGTASSPVILHKSALGSSQFSLTSIMSK